jgi:hypothetical protein
MTDLQLPGQAVNASGKDLAQPTTDFLKDLHLLADETAETGPLKGTPYSLQVITAGILTVTKAWGPIVAVMGSAGAIAAFRSLKENYIDRNASVQVAVVFSGAIILAATMVAIAIMVRSDVQARSEATSAHVNAAARVTDAFLHLTGKVQASATVAATTPSRPSTAELLAALAPSGSLEVRPHGDTSFRAVTGVRDVDGEETQLQLSYEDWIPTRTIQDFSYVRTPSE